MRRSERLLRDRAIGLVEAPLARGMRHRSSRCVERLHRGDNILSSRSIFTGVTRVVDRHGELLNRPARRLPHAI